MCFSFPVKNQALCDEWTNVQHLQWHSRNGRFNFIISLYSLFFFITKFNARSFKIFYRRRPWNMQNIFPVISHAFNIIAKHVGTQFTIFTPIASIICHLFVLANSRGNWIMCHIIFITKWNRNDKESGFDLTISYLPINTIWLRHLQIVEFANIVFSQSWSSTTIVLECSTSAELKKNVNWINSYTASIFLQTWFEKDKYFLHFNLF
jgi:hypothetical protein